MKLRTIELVTYALLGALLVIVQAVLAFLPNIELVSLLIYIYAKVFRWKALIPVYIFVLAEGLLYGFTIWWVTYLYVWAVLVVITVLVRNEASTIVAAAVLSLYGLAFGFLCSLVTFVIGGIGAGISFFTAGIPFDIAHFAGNLTAALVLYYPLLTVVRTLNNKLIHA